MRSFAVLLIIGGLLLALGLYGLGSAISKDLSYDSNLASCNTPLCGPPPPPAWSSSSVLSIVLPLIFLGALVLTLGVVKLRRERRGRLRPIGVQPDTSY